MGERRGPFTTFFQMFSVLFSIDLIESGYYGELALVAFHREG